MFDKQVLLSVGAGCFLTACSSAGPNPEWVNQLNASGYNDQKSVWLAGDGTKGDLYGFPSYQAASQVVEANKGQSGTLVGYIWDARKENGTVAIEVIPSFSADNARRCTGHIRQGLLDCLEQERGFFKSNVTCHINNLDQFYAAGGKRIATDIPNIWEKPQNWSHVTVKGTIRNIEVKGVAFERYAGDASAFGDTGGTYTDGFRYSSVHLDDCRVYTFRGKAILPHS